MGKQKKKQEYAAKLWNRIARVRMPLTVVCILAFGAFIVYAIYIQNAIHFYISFLYVATL